MESKINLLSDPSLFEAHFEVKASVRAIGVEILAQIKIDPGEVKDL